MDSQAQTFGSPARARSWVELVDSGAPAQQQERQSFDRALGMVLNVFRSVDAGGARSERIGTLLPPEGTPGTEWIEPDAQTLSILSRAEGPHDRTFARAITLYRMLIGEGAATGEELGVRIGQLLDDVPTRTDLMRSAVEAAKAYANVQIDDMLRQQPA